MKRLLMMLVAAILPCAIVSASNVDFGSFSLDFTDPILSETNPGSGYGIVNHDYQMGVHEITRSQFDAFRSSVGFPARAF